MDNVSVWRLYDSDDLDNPMDFKMCIRDRLYLKIQPRLGIVVKADARRFTGRHHPGGTGEKIRPGPGFGGG